MKKILISLIFTGLFWACTPSLNDGVKTPGENTGQPETPENPDKPVNPGITEEGINYVWDESVIPEITMHFTLDEWNALLERYDRDNHNSDYFHADITYKKGDEVTEIKDGGVKLKGNTSRRRPEGNGGQKHVKDNADWHHCHYSFNLRKFNKDDVHTVNGIRKMYLKWFKDDATYVREMYCYDLFRRYGIWTGIHDTYCRLWIHIEGDSKPAYLGVYELLEVIDYQYIKRRLENKFESADGNLWKCGYKSGPADLRDLNRSWGPDDGGDYTYEYKGDELNYESAKAQFQDFILKLSGKGEDSFYKWIKEVCDVELLLKTYAVNVAVGMWDDHWVNGNNFYLYFNSNDLYNYKVFFIPYDYDNTLGTSSIIDAGRQNPYQWGSTGLLMERLMKFDEFRKIYKNALLELCDPKNDLFHPDASMARINRWRSRIEQYVSNDTGEDMRIEDRPAGWGNHGEYRIYTSGNNNFFEAKMKAIQGMGN